MKTIVLVDEFRGGHHAIYLRLYTKVCLELGCNVVALSPAPAELEQWVEQNCAEKSEKFSAVFFGQEEIVSPVWKLRRITIPIMRWRRLRAVVRQASEDRQLSVDLVFFMWLDHLLREGWWLIRLLLPVVFPYEWAGIYFHPIFLRSEYPGKSKERTRALQMLRSRNCRWVGVLDEGVRENLQSLMPSQVVVLPDVAVAQKIDESGRVGREIRQKAAGRRIMGLLGSMERRKGLMTFLDMVNGGDDSWFFVVAGWISDRIRSQYKPEELAKIDKVMSGDLSNCCTYLGSEQVNEQTFQALLDVSDVLFAAYHNFCHSSNIVSLAAGLNTPVVVSDGHCMAERVKQYGIGLAVPQGSAGAALMAANELMAHAPDRTGFQRYQRDYSEERLRDMLREIVVTQ